MVLTKDNGVNQYEWRYAQGKRSQVNGVPKETAGRRGIRIETLDIWSGKAGGLETALRTLQQGNTGIGILQETKLIGGIHKKWEFGYDLFHPNMSSTLSLSGMYQKPFIYCRDRIKVYCLAMK